MAANIQAYLENLQQPWGQIYYDILFEQLKDIKVSECLILAVVWPGSQSPSERKSSPSCGA